MANGTGAETPPHNPMPSGAGYRVNSQPHACDPKISDMHDHSIAFIGGGNMATSLIGGLVTDRFPAASIWVVDTNPARLDDLRNRYLVNATEDAAAAIAHADVVTLAVKPQVMREVCLALRDAVAKRKPLVVSLAAGVRTTSIGAWLGEATRVVRAMPNTPALVGSGATALFSGPGVSDEQRSLAESIMRSVGIAVWVGDEDLMDTVTAVSGSGPAYFFYLMEALERAATDLGLAPETARMLTLETAFGAAKMALESNLAPATLRQNVTSPGGTTERAIKTLEAHQVRARIEEAVAAATHRSRELAALFGGNK